jgi:phenylpyruvate tautomerase PptA (4-oxalocrotonate tautomerase family)
MPTYVCTAAAGRLSTPAKTSIAKALTTVHSEEANTPRFVISVIFQELPGKNKGNYFINETAVDADQIWIRGDIRTGRTDEQKTTMVRRIVELASQACGISREHFWVYLCEITKMAEFGSVMPDAGDTDGEARWLKGLPEKVKERYELRE